MIHIYTGEGKGKTTAAFGLALRALGQGQKVLIIQWLKKYPGGEYKIIKGLPRAKILQLGRRKYLQKTKLKAIDYQKAETGLRLAKEAIKIGRYNLIILDEINVALDFDLLPISEVLSLVKSCPTKIELVLTGRRCPPQLIKLAHYVTRMEEVKHPYRKGIKAREGVEY